MTNKKVCQINWNKQIRRHHQDEEGKQQSVCLSVVKLGQWSKMNISRNALSELG